MSRIVRVLNPGGIGLIQDLGRFGYQRFGVSVSGAIDPEALLIGNLLVGNEQNAAGIEVTFGGAEFQFEDETVVAVTGCEIDVFIDGTRLAAWQSFAVQPGSVLKLGMPTTGLRACVSFGGGVAIDPVLGSRASHVSSSIGWMSGRPLTTGDDLPLGAASEGAAAGLEFPENMRLSSSDDMTIRVIPGPQRASFTAAGIETFLSSPYTVTDRSDRQGLRLDGPELEAINGKYDIISDAVAVGSIQVPGDGKPIILVSDRQTTGGYAKIGVVATVDLPLLAQAHPGAVLRFREIAVEEAQTLMRERRDAILNADMTGDLSLRETTVGIDGSSRRISVEYRAGEIKQPGGGPVSVSIDEVRSVARVEEI